MMNSDPRDYRLDISSLPASDAGPSAASGRPFLSVLFDCCGVCRRIYRDPSARFYAGACPRCGKAVRFGVGASGTTNRSFRVW